MAGLSLIGRPSLYSQELAERICKRMAAGELLKNICEDDGMPEVRTIADWVREDREGFAELYARARRVQVEQMADEVIEISDDSTNDWMERQTFDGGTERVVDHEHIARAKLRVDSRKWLLSKLLPERFGDRLAVQALDEHGKPARASVTIVIDGAPSQPRE